MSRLDIETLHRLLRYDPESGALYWKERTEIDCPNSKERQRWNKRYAGGQAFRVKPNGYLEGMVFRSTHRAHRVCWALHHGEWPESDIDHINGVRTDNRISNLRQVTRMENTWNQKRRVTNTTGVTGVSPHKSRWRACIRGKHIGLFNSIEEAVAARKAAELALGFHPNHGRPV